MTPQFPLTPKSQPLYPNRRTPNPKILIPLFIILVLSLFNCRKISPPNLTFRNGFAVSNDTTPPQVVSVQADAGTKTIIITFTEPVYTNNTGSGNLLKADFGYTDNNAGGGASSIASLSDAVGADNIVVLQTNSMILVSDGADKISFTINSIYDTAGNALISTPILINIAQIPPILTGATTLDVDDNGKIDHYKLTFSKAIKDNTFPGYVNTLTLGNNTSDWLVAGYCDGITTFCKIDPTLAADTTDDDNVIYLLFPEVAYDTDAKPELTTITPVLQDLSGTPLAQIFTSTISETDSAEPILYLATAQSGTLNKLLSLSFSEPVYTNAGSGLLVISDFTYTNNYTGTSPAVGASSFSAMSDADGSNNSVSITMDVLFACATIACTALTDGDNLDKVSVTAGQIYDLAGNIALNLASTSSITIAVATGSAPNITSAETMDVNANGKLDHIKLTFDVPMDDSTFPGYGGTNNLGTVTTEWTVAGYANVRIDTRDTVVTSDTDDDNVIYLAFDEKTAACSDNDLSGCDTGVKPNVEMATQSSFVDFDPTKLALTGARASSDSAAPIIVSAKGGDSTTNLTLRFSEAVFTSAGSGNLLASDFSYTDNSGGNASSLSGTSDANGSDGIAILTANANFAIADESSGDTISAVSSQVFDLAGNIMSTTTSSIGVVPSILSVETMDINSNGKIDHYKITFASTVQDNTFPGWASNALGTVTTNWLVSGYSNVRLDTRTASPSTGPGDVANDTILYLTFAEGTTYDTSITPNLTTTLSPKLKRTGSTSTMQPLATSDITESDKALPVIVKAAGNKTTTKLILIFSESVFTNSGGSGLLVLSDFNYIDGNSSGSTSLSSMGIDADGADGTVNFVTTGSFMSSDTADTIAFVTSQVYDARNNVGSNNIIKIQPQHIFDNTDETVSDVDSNLIWQQCNQRSWKGAGLCYGPLKKFQYCKFPNNFCNNIGVPDWNLKNSTFSQAYDTCNLLNTNPPGGFAGRTNWRLPNITEFENFTVNIYPNYTFLFPYTPTGFGEYWWSSTTNSSLQDRAYMNCSCYGSDLKTSKNYVRCVATGP